MENFENSKKTLFLEMKQRFPLMPEEEISHTINKVHGNRELCYTTLHQEYNKNRQLENSTPNQHYTENKMANFPITQSRYFPNANHGATESGSPQWSNNPHIGRQSSHPSYAYNGGSQMICQEGGLSNVQSAPVGHNNQDYFSEAYSSQMRQSHTSPFNNESSYLLNPSLSRPKSPYHSPGASFSPSRTMNCESNSPTMHISTLNINPAPPYPPNQFQYTSHTVGPNQSPSIGHVSRSPSNRQGALVNLHVTPSSSRDARPSIQFSATPGNRSHLPSFQNVEENHGIHISFSSSTGVPAGLPATNPYQLFPEQPSSYHYQHQPKVPPRPFQSRNFPPSSSSQKVQIGGNSSISQNVPSQESFNAPSPSVTGEPRHQQHYHFPIHPVGPISKPQLPHAGEELDYNKALLSHQNARLQLLSKELIRSKDELSHLKLEVYTKEQQLYKSRQHDVYFQPDKMRKLQEEITKLRVDCHCLSAEVDRQSNSEAPLGEVDVGFYGNIFTGQPGHLSSSAALVSQRELDQISGEAIGGANSPNNDTKGETSLARYPHLGSNTPVAGAPLEEDEEEKIKWNCLKCTYLNHPDLNMCELCETERPPYAVDSSWAPGQKTFYSECTCVDGGSVGNCVSMRKEDIEPIPFQSSENRGGTGRVQIKVTRKLSPNQNNQNSLPRNGLHLKFTHNIATVRR